LFWEFSLHPWDIAAGVLLIQAAGGRCTDMHGKPLDLSGPHILADNGRVHGETVALFADIFAGRYRHALPELPD
jgi:myo-inositol-1(or 4)-monophosphatase